MPARSVCLVTLSLSEAGPGRFGRQQSSTDIYHTIPYLPSVIQFSSYCFCTCRRSFSSAHAWPLVHLTAVYAAATTQGPKQASRASTGPKNQPANKNTFTDLYHTSSTKGPTVATHHTMVVAAVGATARGVPYTGAPSQTYTILHHTTLPQVSACIYGAEEPTKK